MRFVEVPAPLEERVGDGIVSQIRGVIGSVASLRQHLNTSLNDKVLTDRTTDAVVEALRPGTIPFFLMVTTIVLMIAHKILVRLQAGRILLEHGHFQREDEDVTRGRPHEE